MVYYRLPQRPSIQPLRSARSRAVFIWSCLYVYRPHTFKLITFCDGKLEIKLQGPYSIRYQVPVTCGSLPHFGFVTTAPTNSRKSPALLKFHRIFLNFVHFYRISRALGLVSKPFEVQASSSLGKQ